MTNNEKSNNYHQSGPQGVGHMENSVLKGNSKVIGRIAKATSKFGFALGLIGFGLGFFAANFNNVDWLSNAQKTEKPVDASGTSGANLTIANDIAGDSSGTPAVPQTSSNNNNKEANGNNNVINGNNNEVTNAGEINHNYQEREIANIVQGNLNSPIGLYDNPDAVLKDISNTVKVLSEPDLWSENVGLGTFTDVVSNLLFDSAKTTLSPGTKVEILEKQNFSGSEINEESLLFKLSNNNLTKLAFETVKVRVLEGPNQGEVGWVSRAATDLEERPVMSTSNE